MTRRRTYGIAAVAGLTLTMASTAIDPTSAHGKALDLYGSLKGGWVTGGGSNSLASNAADYFEIERGPALGLEIGAELLGIDVMINGTRMFDPRPATEAGVENGSGGTFLQFLVGLDGDFALTPGPSPATFLRVGANAGVGLGLHRRVRAPLDNSQVSDKGFVANGVAALDYHLNKFFVVGVELQPGYHVFFPGGAKSDESVNGDNHSRGFHFMGLAFFQVHLDPLTWADEPKKPPKPRHEFAPLESNAPPPAPSLYDDEEEEPRRAPPAPAPAPAPAP